MPNAGKAPRLRKTDCTYFLCPDRKCKLFWKPNCHVPCEHHCPSKAEKAIVCWHCKATIVLPYDHCSWCRVDCPSCSAMNMQRMSGLYRIRRTKAGRK